MAYYAGIDGGGTITKIAICDENSTLIYQGSYPSINCYGVGYDVAKDNLKMLFKSVAAMGYEKFKSVYIGSSSLIDKANSGFIQDFTEFINSDSVEIVGDVNIILKSLFVRPSAVVISGTGSIMGMIKEDDSVCFVGGLGHLIGDEGSAYDIGAKGLRCALKFVEGWGEATALAEELYKYFNTYSIDEIIDKVYGDGADKSVIANFSLNVEEAAAKGDKISNEILIQAANDLFKQFIALIKKSDVKPKEVLISGSVLLKSKVVKGTFIKLLEQFDSSIKPIISEISPEIRAMNLARGIRQ